MYVHRSFRMYDDDDDSKKAINLIGHISLLHSDLTLSIITRINLSHLILNAIYWKHCLFYATRVQKLA